MTTELEELAALDAVCGLDAETRAEYVARLADAGETERSAIAAIYDAAARIAVAGLVPEMPRTEVKQRLQARVLAAGRFVTIRKDAGEWQRPGIPGISMKVLSKDLEKRTAVLLVRAEPGAVYPSHRHTGVEQCYVISGEVIVQGHRLLAGDFHRAEAGSDHDALISPTGAEVLLVVDPIDYFGE